MYTTAIDAGTIFAVCGLEADTSCSCSGEESTMVVCCPTRLEEPYVETYFGSDVKEKASYVFFLTTSSVEHAKAPDVVCAAPLLFGHALPKSWC